LDEVYTIAPSMIANVRLNATRYIQNQFLNSAGFDATTLGFPSYVVSSAQYLALPQIRFGSCNYSSYHCLGTSSTTPSKSAWNSYSIFGDVVKAFTGHSLKFGVDARQFRRANYVMGASQGSFTFDSSWTRQSTSAAAAPLGQDLAAFLLGLPTSGSYDMNAQSTAQSKYLALFLQDDWRVRSNLTLNLGLRFEHDFPVTESYNRIVNGFDTTTPSPISAAAIAAYNLNPISQIPAGQFKVNGGLKFAGAGNRNMYQELSKTFSPRFGLAWTPPGLSGKTVIRGGMGAFVFPVWVNTIFQQGFSQTTQMVSTLNSYLSPAATLSGPFPSGFLLPVGSTSGLSTFLGQSISFYNSMVRNGYALRWQLGVQREFWGHTLVEASYIGNHSIRTPISGASLNFVPRQYLSTSPMRDAADNAVIAALTKVVANPLAGLLPGTNLNGSSTSVGQLLVPYPQFPGSGVIVQNLSGGNSHFHSLNLRVERRLSGGLTLVGNCGFSKLIEQVAYFNESDPLPEKRISSYDRPHHLVLAMTYDLPFGAGRTFGFHGFRVADRLFGGWTFNSVYTLQSGAPLAWGNVVYLGGDLNLDPHRVGRPAFDTTRFLRASAEQPVSNIRVFSTQFSNLLQDMTNQLDLSLLKNIRFTEGRYLQLRFEAFNSLNHPQFGAPNLSPTSSSFGLITGTANPARQVQLGARMVW
jgi:hypothetical protein